MDAEASGKMLLMRTVSGAGSKAEAHGRPAGAAGPCEVGRLHYNTAHIQEHVPVVHRACSTRGKENPFQLVREKVAYLQLTSDTFCSWTP